MKPLSLNTPMVAAVIIGNKTMTRRCSGLELFNVVPDGWELVDLQQIENIGLMAHFQEVGKNDCLHGVDCPFGSIGDRLWVKESFGFDSENRLRYKADICTTDDDKSDDLWIPSVYMAKSAARILLEITDIRIERLLDISEADAIAEGIEELTPWPEAPDRRRFKLYNWPDSGHGEASAFEPLSSFYTLWCSIYGDRAVLENPWVWVISFKKIEEPK